MILNEEIRNHFFGVTDMRLAENAYAIGPSLYDWEREREDLEVMKREANDDAFNKDFYFNM